MPITPNLLLAPSTREEFHDRNFRVMGHAFAVHKDLGRFCDETIYQNELAHRGRESSLGEVVTEAAIDIRHSDFEKTCFVDLLIQRSHLYELKAVSSLTEEHRTQALTYLMLLGLNHGKLINFRSPSVQHRFVSTRLTQQRRRVFTVQCDGWQEFSPNDARFKAIILDLVADWGLFLEVGLYYEAAIHFLGGETAVVQRIEVGRGSRQLGSQRAHLLSEEVAFRISAITREVKSYEQHLCRFIALTRLKAIQWVNFCYHDIGFRTIKK